jgi:hypothetical protein
MPLAGIHDLLLNRSRYIFYSQVCIFPKMSGIAIGLLIFKEILSTFAPEVKSVCNIMKQ